MGHLKDTTIALEQGMDAAIDLRAILNPTKPRQDQ